MAEEQLKLEETVGKCSWCGGTDDHEEFCNECYFCESHICCNCWDGDETCFYPGDGYCPNCKKKIESCPECNAYIYGLMTDPEAQICEKHCFAL